MKRSAIALFALALSLCALPMQEDDFQRESGKRRAAQDALEGKPPPALQVEGWLNSDAMKLADLRGKVVVLKFWGTW